MKMVGGYEVAVTTMKGDEKEDRRCGLFRFLSFFVLVNNPDSPPSNDWSHKGHPWQSQ